MFGLGFWELVVIAVVALLFIGPDKLPRFFRALGRATREFQRASRELRENLSIDEPPPHKPPPRPQRPPVDLRAESSEPRSPSRVVETPRPPPDEWPAAPEGQAESKPAEPFAEIPHPVREVPSGAPPPPASSAPALADLPLTAHRPPPPAPPPIMTVPPAPSPAPPPPTPTPATKKEEG
jgi:TatA/E family protein of Tat protein translocase